MNSADGAEHECGPCPGHSLLADGKKQTYSSARLKNLVLPAELDRTSFCTGSGAEALRNKVLCNDVIDAGVKVFHNSFKCFAIILCHTARISSRPVPIAIIRIPGKSSGYKGRMAALSSLAGVSPPASSALPCTLCPPLLFCHEF